MSKINVFVGQNNSGKSNIIRALVLLQQMASKQRDAIQLDPDLDRHHGAAGIETDIYLPVSTDSESLADFVNRILPDEAGKHFGQAREYATKLLQALPSRDERYAWYGYRANAARDILAPKPETLGYSGGGSPKPPILRNEEWYSLWNALTGHSGGSLLESHIPETLIRFSPLKSHPQMSVHLVGAHRRIGDPQSAYEGLSGSGLIRRLAELQIPGFAKRGEQAKFARINDFVRDVTGSRSAKLQIPHSADEIQVDLDGKLLPIESLGTGIHQVIIFAAAATAVDDALVCIEEPEIHLHPRLQKKLVTYLSAQTTNQYAITSHSAHFLDLPEASVFHVRLNSTGETEISHVRSSNDQAMICWDLGYRASDLLQANCVIWVEGPSDRIYLNAWLRQIAPDLREGVAYSIMFYGGRLLSHLSAADPEIEQFIALKRLNRNVAILIDSDRRNAKSELSETKVRVANEVQESGGLAWVTAGREIENYVPAAALQIALNEMHGDCVFPSPSQYGCSYKPTNRQKNFKVDKVRLAKRVLPDLTLEPYDLRARLEGLVEMIRRANE